jgi:hypothetical protein
MLLCSCVLACRGCCNKSVDELDRSNFAKHVLMLSEARVLLIEVLECWGAGALLFACLSAVYCCAAAVQLCAYCYHPSACCSSHSLCVCVCVSVVCVCECAVKPLLLLTF